MVNRVFDVIDKLFICGEKSLDIVLNRFTYFLKCIVEKVS